MAAHYLPYDPQQMMLLPEAMQEWLPEGHLAYFIDDAVDGLDLSAFHARYEKDGPRNQPFHPGRDAAMTTIAGRAAATASPGEVATNGPSACPRTKPRRTSPTPIAAS
jgi:hypothetical protein